MCPERVSGFAKCFRIARRMFFLGSSLKIGRELKSKGNTFHPGRDRPNGSPA